MASTSLEQAITAIKAGDKQNGRWFLAQALQTDPGDDKIWIWMSAVVDSDAQRRECLERALSINPHNDLARRGLSKLQAAAFAGDLAQPMVPAPAQPASASPPALSLSPDNGKAADRPLPIPPAATNATVDFVVKELSRNRQRSEIVMALCNEMNFSWEQAEAFIRKVELQNRTQITQRRSPLLLALGIGLILGGLVLGGFGVYELLNGVLFFGIDLIVVYFSMPTPVMVITGLAMIAGGSWGVLRTIGSLARK
ncbi:MAG TPA: hypothetical protein VJG32_09495 [Anaerolineae bacterium]|nr:hypothetical protein [Anaerolineae bacterium]